MKNLLKILSVSVIIGLLFSLGGCSSIARKISDEAKTKISEGIQDAMSEENDDEDDEDTNDEDETEATEAQDDTDSDSNDNNDDSTAITTGEGDGMEWPTENMGPIDPVSCKIVSVYTEDSAGYITFQGMQREEADQYMEDFESMGFTEGMISDDDAGILFVKVNDSGDTIMFSRSPEGEGMLSYTPASES